MDFFDNGFGASGRHGYHSFVRRLLAADKDLIATTGDLPLPRIILPITTVGDFFTAANNLASQTGSLNS